MKTINFEQEIKSLLPLFQPESLAIIGASENPFKPSGQPLVSLINAGFKGKIYPVNPKHTTLCNLPCYPALIDVPGSVDLAIIAVPAKYTLDQLQQCADKGVKGVIIFTSGFAEVGPEGAKIQMEITELAQKTGMRVCGPNCMGIFSSRNALMANFSVTELPEQVLVPDFLGFISQSGGFGAAIYQMIKEKGYGFSHFVSTGNEADVDFSQYMGFMARDNYTRVIGGYLEGVKDGQKFINATDMALQNNKPILLIKAGRYPAAAKAAASHTGALVGSDKVYSAVFKQKGIIRIESLEEYQIVLSILASNKCPKGKRIAILATSGGSGVALTDKCSFYGLEVAPLQAETRAKLDNVLPAFASSANPVDITSAILTQPGLLEQCAEIVINDPGIDMLITAYWALHGDRTNLEQMVRVSKKTDKPIFNIVWGPEEAALQALHFLNDNLIPAAKEVDFAIRSLAVLADYSEFKTARSNKNNEDYSIQAPPSAKKMAGEILNNLKPGAKLTEYEAKQVLRAYGISTTREVLTKTTEKAVQAAKEIGYPVVMKIMSPDILHKTEAGGVLLNIATDQEVVESFNKIIENARKYNQDALVQGVLVQEMLSGGTEIIVGAGKDPVFGSTIIAGLGGIFVEVLEDVALRVAPVSNLDAREMLEELKGKKIFEGVRGKEPVDKNALVEIIQKVSRLVEDFPQIAELDINPLLLFPKGAVAVDALIVLQ
ncbi:acetyltransferase [Desulfotomaculum arcticum]|uniref:Acetyltransferase n=1 Tax=Desulfotruncus arcticus DSM 17038 TaxID=1121424 RepID=A0A1I2NHC2_9FIRM|nr:acetate--CoA ligase family protein [Desulfotruncus arcticus]SFG00701.1 acetyltransferase [Desulfotomaculum arcticum] [Desulfotruncus arcticus DSM 17038]